MFVRKVFLNFRCYVSVKDSLKVLELNTPTTKGEIKKKYLILAKKYHPDANQEIKKITNQIKKKEAHTKLEERFVELSKAYQYLKEMSEEDINSLRDKNPSREDSQSFKKSQSERQKGPKRRMTTQEMTRQQAYEYFNKVYRRQAMEQEIYDRSSGNNNKPKQSLFKTIPEIFVGFLLLALMLGDWSYRVYKRKQGEEVKPTSGPTRLQYNEVFKGFNSNDKFNKVEKNKQFTIIE